METLKTIIIEFVIGFIVVIGIGLLYGILVFYLWNWLMPIIFGLTKITFFQAIGVTLLSSFLFKSTNSK